MCERSRKSGGPKEPVTVSLHPLLATEMTRSMTKIEVFPYNNANVDIIFKDSDSFLCCI